MKREIEIEKEMSNNYNNTINNSTNYNQSSILNQANIQKEQLKIRIKFIDNEKEEQINTYILNQTNSIDNLHSQILEKLKIDFPTENINRDLLKKIISSQIKEFNLNNEGKSDVLKAIKDNKNVQKTINQVKRIKTNSVNLNNNDVYKVKQQLKILFPSKSIKSYDIDLSIMSKNESRKVFNFNKDEEDVFNICKNENFNIGNHSFQTDSEGSGDIHVNNNKPSRDIKKPIIEKKKYTPDNNRTKNNYILPSFLDLILQNKQRASILSRKQYNFLKNSCISYVDSFSILCLNEKYIRRNKEASGNTTFLENSIFGKGRRGTRKGLLNTNTLSRTIKKSEMKEEEKQVSSVSIFNINTINQLSNKNVSSNFLNINSGHSNHSLQRNILKFQKEKGVVRNKLKFMTIKKEKPDEIGNLLNAKSINNISNTSIKNNNQELSVINNLKSTKKVNSQFKTINDEWNNKNILNSSSSNKYLNRQSSKNKSQKQSNKEIEYILIEGQPTKKESFKSIVNDSDFTKNDLSIATNLTQKSKLKSKKSLNRTLEILNQHHPKESKVDVLNIVENDNDANFASNSFKSQSNSQNKKGSTFYNVVSKKNLLEFNNNSINLFDISSKGEEKINILNSDNRKNNKNSNNRLNNTNSKKKSRKSKKSKSKQKENENEIEKEEWKEKIKKEKVVDCSYFERLSNSKRVIKNVDLYSNNDENYIIKKKKTIENSKSKSKNKTISQETSKEKNKSDYFSNTKNPFLVNRLTNQINEYINRNITEILNRFYDFIVFYLKKNQIYIETCKIENILDYINHNLNHNDYTKYEEKLNMCGVNIKLIIIDILKAYKHQVFNKKDFVECGKEVFLKSKVE